MQVANKDELAILDLTKLRRNLSFLLTLRPLRKREIVIDNHSAVDLQKDGKKNLKKKHKRKQKQLATRKKKNRVDFERQV